MPAFEELTAPDSLVEPPQQTVAGELFDVPFSPPLRFEQGELQGQEDRESYLPLPRHCGSHSIGYGTSIFQPETDPASQSPGDGMHQDLAGSSTTPRSCARAADAPIPPALLAPAEQHLDEPFTNTELRRKSIIGKLARKTISVPAYRGQRGGDAKIPVVGSGEQVLCVLWDLVAHTKAAENIAEHYGPALFDNNPA